MLRKLVLLTLLNFINFIFLTEFEYKVQGVSTVQFCQNEWKINAFYNFNI